MKHKFFVIFLAVLILLGWFYWFQYRPANIRSYCYRWIKDLPGEVEELRTTSAITRYKALYDRCLNEKGLK